MVERELWGSLLKRELSSGRWTSLTQTAGTGGHSRIVGSGGIGLISPAVKVRAEPWWQGSLACVRRVPIPVLNPEPQNTIPTRNLVQG